MQSLKELVIQAQSEQPDAYNTIIYRFQDMAVGYAYSLLGDFHKAEDAAQEAFIHAYLDLDKLQDPAAFPGWFRRIVFTQCNRMTRGKQLSTIDIETKPQISSHETDPVTQIENAQQKDQIESAIQTLPEQERTVIALYYINEFSQTEIATFLELPVTTINNRLHAARKHLKQELMNMTKNNLQSKRPSQNDTFANNISTFIAGIKAVTTGNLPELQTLLKEHPDLITSRADNEHVDKKRANGYFAGATLLHFVAGNPIRGELPSNIVEITQTLLDSGADVDAVTDFGDWSWTTLGLVASGKQAYEQGYTEQLVDTLVNIGADVNHNNGMNLYGALLHTQECQGQKEVAHMLYERGAKVDLCLAAGLGDLDLVKSFFLQDGTLKPDAYALYRPAKDHMQNPSDQEILEEAFVWACFNNSLEVVEFLLEKGININAITSVVGCHTTGLHRAASAGWEDMVKFLISKGADLTIKDSQHQCTPLEWAKAANRTHLIEILQSHQN